ncbi:MAG: diguanylate cyclase [Pseudomonadaceae bacterium]
MTCTVPEDSHWIVKLNYRNRTASFALLFAAIGVHFAAFGHGWLPWTLLVIQFLIYPHLMYLRASRASTPLASELNSLLCDCFLFGIWISWLGFPLWITYTMVTGVTINLMVFRGPKGLLQAAVALSAGMALSLLFHKPHLAVYTNWPSSLLCIIGLSVYLMMVGNVAFTRNDRIRETRNQLHQSQDALQQANLALQQQLEENKLLQQKLRDLADRDPLTDTYNRRYFDVTIARELGFCQRHGQPLALILIDIDHFKSVNDDYGHQAGDQLLIALATLLGKHSRASDIVCRFGGEEFLVALPNTDCATAQARAEEYRNAFAATSIQWQEQTVGTTISLGVACYPVHAGDAEGLLQCADIALYRAKKSGRNRVVTYQNEQHSSAAQVASD